MPIKVIRKILHYGLSSYVVALPKEWCRYFNLKPKDSVEVIANSDVIIRPLDEARFGVKNE